MAMKCSPKRTGAVQAFAWLGRPLGSPVGLLKFLSMVGTVLVFGCFTQTPPNDGNGDGDGSEPGRTITAQMISPTTNFGVSVLDTQPIAVLYTVTGTPDAIFGYFVPVADLTANSEAVGDPIVVATDLKPGTSRFFQFVPSDAGQGFFRVGIRVVVGNTEIRRESSGVIDVQGHPEPVFIEPTQLITEVQVGDVVNIVFNAGDPQDNVRWRLFFLAPTDSRISPPDVRGTQLGDPGSGNHGEFLWEIEDLEPGNYQLGLAATDSGFSVSETVTQGLADRIITIPSSEVSTPIIRVLAP
jgi:hypothetical protein